MKEEKGGGEGCRGSAGTVIFGAAVRELGVIVGM